MIGFGLLGSASSTFIREHVTREPGQPLVSDLVGVIIRGLSAAILVFLAVEGRLAIFGVPSGAPSPEPNPFVIFLTCLVAAVFSEVVWQAASKRLREALRRGDQEGGEAEVRKSNAMKTHLVRPASRRAAHRKLRHLG